MIGARSRTSARVAMPRMRQQRMACRAQPSDTQIKEAIKKAEEACEDAENKGGCANAWDDVEELSAAAAHNQDKAVNDPLEEYCKSEPDADECRVYED